LPTSFIEFQTKLLWNLNRSRGPVAAKSDMSVKDDVASVEVSLSFISDMSVASVRDGGREVYVAHPHGASTAALLAAHQVRRCTSGEP
jgi:hypothetical protein